MSNRPACELRLGQLKAVIWANETSSGLRYSVQFTKLYRKDDEWQQTDSFDRDDLLLLAKLSDQAHTWICEKGRVPEQTDDPPHRNGQRTASAAAR